MIFYPHGSRNRCAHDLAAGARWAHGALETDRGDRRAAQIIIDLAGEAVIGGLAGEAAARADPDVAPEHLMRVFGEVLRHLLPRQQEHRPRRV